MHISSIKSGPAAAGIKVLFTQTECKLTDRWGTGSFKVAGHWGGAGQPYTPRTRLQVRPICLKTPWHRELRLKSCFALKWKDYMWVLSETGLGETNNTTTSKILTCVSINLHLTKGHPGVMFGGEIYRGGRNISAISTMSREIFPQAKRDTMPLSRSTLSQWKQGLVTEMWAGTNIFQLRLLVQKHLQ